MICAVRKLCLIVNPVAGGGRPARALPQVQAALRARGRTFAGIASCGFDSVVNRIANETTFVRGSLVYALALLRALPAWQAAGFEVTLDGGEVRRFTGYSVAAANSKQFGGGMRLAP